MTWLRVTSPLNFWDSKDGKHRIVPVHKEKFIVVELGREQQVGEGNVNARAFPTLGKAMASVE